MTNGERQNFIKSTLAFALSSKGISVALTIAGAGAIVAAAFVGKKFYPPEEFGKLAGMITINQMATAFSCAGYNHSLLRLIDRKSKTLEVPVHLLWQVVLGNLIASIVSAAFFTSWFLPGNFPSILFLVISNQVAVMLSALLRANDLYFLSQLALQLWRLTTFAVVVAASVMSFSLTPMSVALAIGVVNIAISTLIAIRNYHSLHFIASSQQTSSEDQPTSVDFLTLSMGFFASMISMSLLRNFDRLVSARVLGLADMGNLFFIGTIVCYPFFLVSGQLTFFQLPRYRRLITHKLLAHDTKVWTSLALAGALVTILCIAVLNTTGVSEQLGAPIPLKLATIYAVIGAAAVIYSNYSAAFGAVASAATVWRANLLTIILITISVASISLIKPSITTIITTMAALWLFRTAIFHWECHHCIHEPQEMDGRISTTAKSEA